MTVSFISRLHKIIYIYILFLCEWFDIFMHHTKFLQYYWLYSLCCTVAVQSLSSVWLSETPWTAACQASLSFTISQTVLKLMSIELVMPSNHLILSCPPFLLPSIFLSIKVFPNESALCIRCPKYWSFSFSISPSNEYLGLISLTIGWFDLLAVQGTLKSLPQHHSSKHQFFGAQPSLWFNFHIRTLF